MRTILVLASLAFCLLAMPAQAGPVGACNNAPENTSYTVGQGVPVSLAMSGSAPGVYVFVPNNVEIPVPPTIILHGGYEGTSICIHPPPPPPQVTCVLTAPMPMGTVGCIIDLG
jgi:hypothetical protein